MGKQGFVNVYEFDYAVTVENKKVLRFEEYNLEWLDFIISCRNGEKQYLDYDVIVGGIANDTVFNTVEFYLDGLINKGEALGRLQYHKPNLQLYIVNLVFKESREI